MTVPEIRSIDPDAEAGRLAADRIRADHVLSDEVHRIDYDGQAGLVRVRVTSTIPALVLPPGLGLALYDLVTEQCYPPSEPGDA